MAPLEFHDGLLDAAAGGGVSHERVQQNLLELCRRSRLPPGLLAKLRHWLDSKDHKQQACALYVLSGLHVPMQLAGRVDLGQPLVVDAIVRAVRDGHGFIFKSLMAKTIDSRSPRRACVTFLTCLLQQRDLSCIGAAAAWEAHNDRASADIFSAATKWFAEDEKASALGELLLRILNAPKVEFALRASALEALCRQASRSSMPLAWQWLHSSDPRMRRGAVQCLAMWAENHRSVGCFRALVQLRNDGNEQQEIRHSANMAITSTLNKLREGPYDLDAQRVADEFTAIAAGRPTP